jgi:hypothetical protein
MKKIELKEIIRKEVRKALNESQQVDKELYQLKKQFLPAFEEYVDLYVIDRIENGDRKSVKVEINFAKELQDVLYKLKHGEI